MFDGAPADAELRPRPSRPSQRGPLRRTTPRSARRWRAATNPQEEIRYLYALVATPDEATSDHGPRADARPKCGPRTVRTCSAWRCHTSISTDVPGNSSNGPVGQAHRAVPRRTPTSGCSRGPARSATGPGHRIEAFLGDHPLEHGGQQVGPAPRAHVGERRGRPNGSPRDRTYRPRTDGVRRSVKLAVAFEVQRWPRPRRGPPPRRPWPTRAAPSGWSDRPVRRTGSRAPAGTRPGTPSPPAPGLST